MRIINTNSHLVKILSNYLGRLWNLLSIFILVPIYIKYLGIENYAVIGFYTVILGIIGFADAGMSSAIIKEFATNITNSEKYHILRKIEIIYWLIIIIISLIIISFSGFIAHNWLTSKTITFNDLRNFVMLIGIGASIQMVSSIYFGALFGLGCQVAANNYQILWTTAKSLFVIVLFWIFKPSLYVFLIWQIICNIIYILILRFSVVRNLRRSDDTLCLIPLSNPIPKRVWTYIGGMTFVAIISAINIQSDKLVMSYFFDLKIFGYYSVASILSQIPVLISSPMGTFAFPLFSRFVNEKEKFEKIFVTFTNFIYLFIFVALFLLLAYPLEIFSQWSRQSIEPTLANDFKLLIRTLSLGSLFLAMQFPFYSVLMANSKTKYTVYQGIVQVILGVPLLIYFAKFYGIKFVGIPWLSINLLAFIYLMVICSRKYIKINVFDFIFKVVFLQAIVSGIVVGVGYLIYRNFTIPFILNFILSGIAALTFTLMFNNLLNKRKALAFKHLYDFPRG